MPATVVAPLSVTTTRPFAGQRGVLVVVLVVEILAFGLIGTNFLTLDNAAEVTRLSVELGLLAVALTPVIVSGGIDLSVGSLMGLSAVVLGKLWRDGRLPIGVAVGGTLALGAVAGGLNGWLITRLRIPPLIVTLGSFSLFRGLAEGLTGGVDNFTGFPEGFLRLGQGYFAGRIPVQLPILIVATAFFWAFLHRTIHGRAIFAIGFSPEGARHAGIPVERRVLLVYLLSGLLSSLAAVVYVAHLGQAKADAGTGYELLAITAVVLGGTSIFGGRGSVLGTVLGLFVIAVLQNGLRLADLPAELAGVLTGVLLLATIRLDWLAPHPTPGAHSSEGELNMKNSQLAVLCTIILIGAGVVAAGNWLLVRSLPSGGTSSAGKDGGSAPGKKLTIAMMPKSKGNDYFRACHKGAEEAAEELGVELLWDGPTQTDPAAQNRIIDTWITRGVDVIAVAVENPGGLSDVLRKARQRGIKVVTWDADAEPNARDFFVNQATSTGIGNALMDTAARVMNNEGEYAVITASLTAANQIEWTRCIDERQKMYPKIRRVALRPCDDLQKKATDEASAILNAHPKVKVIMAICSPAVPGAAEAVQFLERKDVKVIGLGLPNDNKRFVHAGITDTVVLWNTMDLGYLAVQAAVQLKEGRLRPGDTSIQAGRLRNIEIQGDNILLGKPFAFTKENIDQFDF
jgi:rhamnose transport system permease protein